MRMCIGIILFLTIILSYNNTNKSKTAQNFYYLEELSRTALNNMYDFFTKKMQTHTKRNNLIKGLNGIITRHKSAQAAFRKHLSAVEVEGSSTTEVEGSSTTEVEGSSTTEVDEEEE